MDVMEEVDVIPVEEVEAQLKAEREEKIVPQGTYEGTVISYTKVEESEKSENNQFKGVPLYNVGIMFYDCPEFGKKKSGWFKFTPAKVLGPSGKPKTAYTTLVGLIKATDKVGQPVADAFEQAKVSRCKYRVGVFESPETGEKYNFLRSVSAA